MLITECSAGSMGGAHSSQCSDGSMGGVHSWVWVITVSVRAVGILWVEEGCRNRCPRGTGGSRSFPGAGGGAEEHPLQQLQSHRGGHSQEGAAGQGQGQGGGQAQAGPGQPAGGDQGNSEGKRGLDFTLLKESSSKNGKIPFIDNSTVACGTSEEPWWEISLKLIITVIPLADF